MERSRIIVILIVVVCITILFYKGIAMAKMLVIASLILISNLMVVSFTAGKGLAERNLNKNSQPCLCHGTPPYDED